nr:immunoglobulin heavy chain junction region [Macaca mulatta]MOX59008.1 immunoglobulin heavy chain junction region [Macaca mulatta]MOX59638.1 immunoglobulin heavy chain junction region [Macaca mulatta]MOX61020.1 immunoglobulin heavy chain junction region [Macaca mulatta]MOX61132.1 immunoglobulin heavy chain junction region [Macaca mulatta]
CARRPWNADAFDFW